MGVALQKLRQKCPAMTENDLREIEDRFMQALYMQGLTPPQWYKGAVAIVEDVLGRHFETLAEKINQILFVSSRFHFAEALQPEILSHYEIGEPIPEAIREAYLSLEDHTMHDIPGYLENRLGSTLIELLRNPSVAIEIFIGPRQDMLTYYRSIEPPLALRGELDSPTSTEFYLFEQPSHASTIVIRGISNRSRFHHQLWQLRYAGIDLGRVCTRGTVETMLGPQIEALRRELANLPVKPTIAVIGQRWWPMEILGRLAQITGPEGQAYDTLQPTTFKIGPFTFDYLIANVAGTPASRNKVGIVSFRMPNGSLAGETMQALVENGTMHVLFVGAGGSLDARSRVGSYQIFTEAAYGTDVHTLPDSLIFTPRLGDDYPLVESGRNVTVDSPLEESKRWLEASRARGNTVVDVESAHIFGVLARAAAENPHIRVTPGLFISDVVGGDESLTEKISSENAYAHLRPLLESYFSQIGIAGVYDARGVLHAFPMSHIETNPALVAVAQAIPDVARQAILGVRFDGEDFRVVSAPMRRVDYPNFQSMGGHKHILYVIPPADAKSEAFNTSLDSADPDKLFLVFPANAAPDLIERAHRSGYETIIIIESDQTTYSHADYIISSDSGWGTYETVVAANAHAVAIFGDPEGYGELLVTMENKGRAIFVLDAWARSSVVQQLDDFETFDPGQFTPMLEKTLRLRKLEKWVARVRPDIEIVPLSGVKAYAEGRSLIGVSGSSRIAQFDPEATETVFREMLAQLNPQDVMFGTGGTDYGVEKILHSLIREAFPAFRLIGFITNEGRGDELGTPAITVAGNDWFGKSVPFLNAIDYLITVSGGGVIHQELLMAYKAEIPLFPLAGSGMKSDEFLKDHPEVPRYYSGADIAGALKQKGS